MIIGTKPFHEQWKEWEEAVVQNTSRELKQAAHIAWLNEFCSSCLLAVAVRSTGESQEDP